MRDYSHSLTVLISTVLLAGCTSWETKGAIESPDKSALIIVLTREDRKNSALSYLRLQVKRNRERRQPPAEVPWSEPVDLFPEPLITSLDERVLIRWSNDSNRVAWIVCQLYFDVSQVYGGYDLEWGYLLPSQDALRLLYGDGHVGQLLPCDSPHVTEGCSNELCDRAVRVDELGR
jgi:hypothetical protein